MWKYKLEAILQKSLVQTISRQYKANVWCLAYPKCNQRSGLLLKFGHSEKATKIWKISLLIWHLLSKRRIMWEIVSNFVAFLENLNFNILWYDS